MKNVKPRQDYLLIRVDEKPEEEKFKKSKGGIILPETSRGGRGLGLDPDSQIFTVVEVGSEVKDSLKGCHVLFNEGAFRTFTDEEGTMLGLIKEEHVMAVYEE